MSADEAKTIFQNKDISIPEEILSPFYIKVKMIILFIFFYCIPFFQIYSLLCCVCNEYRDPPQSLQSLIKDYFGVISSQFPEVKKKHEISYQTIFVFSTEIC